MNNLLNNVPKFEPWKGKMPQEEAERRVKIVCKYRNYEFLGFCDKNGNDCEYYGNTTYLKLHCNICGNNWNSTRFSHFTKENIGCPRCGNKKCQDSQKLVLKTILERIYNKCKEQNYTFIDFCNKEGNVINWDNEKKLYLKIKCNDCFKEYITSYKHFKYRGYTCECKYLHTKENEKRILNKILKECEEQNIQFNEFIGDGHINYKTKLDLTCLNCGYNWTSTTVGNLVTLHHGCHQCKGGVKKSMDDILKNINKKAKELDCTFIGFVDGYENEYSLLKLKCNKCGYTWSTTCYNNFMNNESCPNCNLSFLEREISAFLKDKNIIYEIQKRTHWLGKQSLDFYLPQYNIAIECQGIQHFKKIKYFGGEYKYNKTIERDKRKKQLCEENGVKLLYYSNLHIDYPYQVYEDKDELLQKILEESN